MKLFSKKDSDSKEKKERLKEKLRLALPIAGGASTAWLSNNYANGLTKEYEYALRNSSITAEDSKKIMDSLLKKAKDQGIEVINDPGFNNSAYLGGTSAKRTKKILDRIKKQYPEKYKRIVVGNEKLFENLGKDAVILGNGTLADVDALSHELGHAQYTKSGRSKNILAKAAHKTMIPSKLAATSLGSAGAFALGARSGYKTEKKRSEGKKVSLWDKTKPLVMPAAIVSPLLIAEGAASLKGLKMMKEAGASKELLKQSKRRLKDAFGTYASQATKPILASSVGSLSGQTLASMQNRNKEETKDLDKKALLGAGISAATIGSILGLGKIADKKVMQQYIEHDNMIKQMSDYEKRGDLKKANELSKKIDEHLDKMGDNLWSKLNSHYKRLKNNPGKTAAIAAGVTALGASIGAGYGVSKLKGRKRNED